MKLELECGSKIKFSQSGWLNEVNECEKFSGNIM